MVSDGSRLNIWTDHLAERRREPHPGLQLQYPQSSALAMRENGKRGCPVQVEIPWPTRLWEAPTFIANKDAASQWLLSDFIPTLVICTFACHLSDFLRDQCCSCNVPASLPACTASPAPTTIVLWCRSPGRVANTAVALRMYTVWQPGESLHVFTYTDHPGYREVTPNHRMLQVLSIRKDRAVQNTTAVNNATRLLLMLLFLTFVVVNGWHLLVLVLPVVAFPGWAAIGRCRKLSAGFRKAKCWWASAGQLEQSVANHEINLLHDTIWTK